MLLKIKQMYLWETYNFHVKHFSSMILSPNYGLINYQFMLKLFSFRFLWIFMKFFCSSLVKIFIQYCIHGYFCGGFIFASQTLQKSPLQFIYIYTSNENIRKITKLSPRKFLHLVQNRENYGIYTVYNFKKNSSWHVLGLLITVYMSQLLMYCYTSTPCLLVSFYW